MQIDTCVVHVVMWRKYKMKHVDMAEKLVTMKKKDRLDRAMSRNKWKTR